MSYNEEHKEFLESLDAPGADNRLSEITGKVICPICENAEWTLETQEAQSLLDSPPAAPVFVIKDTRAHFGPAPSIPAIAYSCKKCGFIRQHSIRVLKDNE